MRASFCRWSLVVLSTILTALVLSLRAGASAELPVLLVYGFQPIPGFRPAALWEDIAERLAHAEITTIRTIEIEAGHDLFVLAAGPDGRDVFLSDYALAYEPTVRDIRFYAARLAAEIAYITAFCSCSRLDVVAHSMGALVARAYVECDDFRSVLGSEDFPDHGTVYRDDVRTLISLAAPHHGAFLASFGQWLSRLGRQLSPESTFLELLNRDRVVDGRLISLHPDVRYVSMAGQTCFGCGLRRDEAVCLRECVEAGLAWHGSDLVVLMASAYLPEAENVACLGMDHVGMHTDPVLADAIETILDGAPAPQAIYAEPELRLDAADGSA